MDDEKFMRAALREARSRLVHTSPNPAVGAVIVRGGRIVARGFHRGAGKPHAEIEAIRALKNARLSQGATICVTLEPCSTHGRTPPCVDAIVRARFARVVIGAIDPNPAHAGRGVGLLQKTGIEVRAGVLADECRELNLAFNKWIVTGMPFVIAKAALSLDGRLTRPVGEGQWLSSAASRADAHKLRASVDAILVGAGTVRADNPRLTVRGVKGARQPWRIVLAGKKPLPKYAHLFMDENRDRTLVFRGKTLRAVLHELGRKQITSVLIEGGGAVLGEAFDRRLVDRVQFYFTPILCGGPDIIGGLGAVSSLASLALKNPRYEKIGGDVRMIAECSA